LGFLVFGFVGAQFPLRAFETLFTTPPPFPPKFDK